MLRLLLWHWYRAIRALQSDFRTVEPAMFFMINNQNARQQLYLMTEKPKRRRSRQKGRIHKNARPKWHIIRHLPWLIEEQGGDCLRRHGRASESHPHIRNRNERLIDDHLWAS